MQKRLIRLVFLKMCEKLHMVSICPQWLLFGWRFLGSEFFPTIVKFPFFQSKSYPRNSIQGQFYFSEKVETTLPLTAKIWPQQYFIALNNSSDIFYDGHKSEMDPLAVAWQENEAQGFDWGVYGQVKWHNMGIVVEPTPELCVCAANWPQDTQRLIYTNRITVKYFVFLWKH